jgi:hypothetical protein
MRGKATAIAYVLLALGLSWFWISADTPHDLPGAEYATEEGGERHEPRADSKQELSSRKPFPPRPGRTRAVPESGVLGSEAPRSRSTWRRFRATPERDGSASGALAVDAGNGGSAVDDEEAARRSEEFDRFKQLVEELRESFQEVPGGDPLASDAAGLDPEDVGRLDLDGDGVISAWEIEKARRRLERAELHPERFDRGDAAYPIGREEYARSEDEFYAVDRNRDDEFDAAEYYEFLVHVDRITLSLDRDGDRAISRDESRLSEYEFAPLDVDGSGDLQRWEMRRAIALEAFN